MEKVKEVKKVEKYRVSKQIFENLSGVLNTRYHSGTKLIVQRNRIKKIYVEIPFSVALKYNLISLNLSSFNVTREDGTTYTELIKIGKDKCECINGKYYAWVKPVMSNNKLYLYFKKEYIPASCIFGRSINRLY